MKKIIITFIVMTVSFFCSSLVYAFDNQDNSSLENDGSVLLPAQKQINNNNFTYSKNELNKEWKQFQIQNSTWSIYFDKLTKLPHRAFGKPIQIEGFKDISASNVKEAAKAFIDQNKSLFGFSSNDIQIRKALQINKLWSVSFFQVYNGIEVLLSEVELRIRPDGKVMAFGAEFFKGINLETNQVLNTETIKEQAISGLNITNKKNAVQSSGEMFIIPVRTSESISFHLTSKVTIDNLEANQKFESFVDAQSGELIWRRNLLTNIESFVNVKAMIKRNSRFDAETEEPLANFEVKIKNVLSYTDSQGIAKIYTFSSTSDSLQMEGEFARIIHSDITNAKLFFDFVPGQEHKLIWDNSNSHRYERYLYYYANYAHDYFTKIDTVSKAMDFQLKVTIRNLGQANAYSETDNGNITFVGCGNANYFFVESPSVLYHEYGHSVNTRLYKELGLGQGMINMSCHEALADLNASLMTNENRIGYLAFSDTTKVIRNLVNNFEYPKDVVGESHHDGQILAGAFWDLKLTTDLDYTRWLVHYTKKMGTPDDEDLGVAFNEWFIETLITDDSYGDGDNDLSNGCPNAEKIITAFNKHKIGTNLAMSLTYSHTPLEDTDKTDSPYIVDFNLLNPITFINTKPQNVKVIYSTDNFKTNLSSEAVEVANGVYTAQIPAQERGTFVQYYVVATDPGSNMELQFSNDLIRLEPYIFLVGYSVGANINFDIPEGWSYSVVTDNATKGFWEIAFPMKAVYGGTLLLQPDTDPSGQKSMCLVTGANVASGTQGLINNMPNGNTTVLSPTFDISKTVNPVLKFYKFYTNYIIFRASIWKTFLSSDAGSSWVIAENTDQATNEWEKKVFFIEDYINKSTQFRVKFVFETMNSQGYPGSLSEGLVDDLQILSASDAPQITEVNEFLSYPTLKLYPNPTMDYVMFDVPNNELINNIKISTLIGQVVIDIYESNSNKSNSKIPLIDFSGNNLSKGVYCVQVKTNNNTYIKKLIIQ